MPALIHYASPSFQDYYKELPRAVGTLADRVIETLKAEPDHPDLNLRKIGRFHLLRVGLSHRALGVAVEDGLLWFWIGGLCPLEDAPRMKV